jgi:phosphoserine phosphatase RsbU/P
MNSLWSVCERDGFFDPEQYNNGQGHPMYQVATDVVQAELRVRRGKLESALAEMGRPATLIQLLDEVDGALERIERGVYGICESCHEPIEADRIAADPLLRFCIEHLDAKQREALQEDIALASRVQRGLLPPNDVTRNGWEFCYYYLPAGPVGGDHCDLIFQGEDVVFLLGDASGKGVASSLLASHLHAVFRSLFAETVPLAQTMRRANRVFCESTLTSHFATVVCGRASPGGELEVASAGHCPALRMQRGEVNLLDATGLPLGLFCSSEFTAHRLRLERGDSLLLYSDGLTEAHSADAEEYGINRLQSVAAAAAEAGSSRGFVGAVLADWNRFRGKTPPADDLTVMVARRTA